MRFALIRVGTGVALGFLLAVWLPRQFGVEGTWGAPGLAFAGSLAGWLEFSLLRRSLGKAIGGRPATNRALLLRLWGSATMAAVVAWGVLQVTMQHGPMLVAIVVMGTFGIVYVGCTHLLGVNEARAFVARFTRGRGDSV
jgi:putative peptidoglycan lipid II flippase